MRDLVYGHVTGVDDDIAVHVLRLGGSLRVAYYDNPDRIRLAVGDFDFAMPLAKALALRGLLDDALLEAIESKRAAAQAQSLDSSTGGSLGGSSGVAGGER